MCGVCPNLRYRTIRNPQKYGQAVWKHLEVAKDRLLEDERNRDPWKRLVKDIVDFINCEKNAKNNAAKPKAAK